MAMAKEDSDASRDPAASEGASAIARDGAQKRHNDANAEIQFLKEQLNATVEQYEAANEELKASNEELQAMNEELRSAAEELETNKDCLLYTSDAADER